jgi:hypothetical protein
VLSVSAWVGVGVLLCGCCMVSAVRRGSGVPVRVLLPGAVALLLAYCPTGLGLVSRRVQLLMSTRPVSSLAFANRLSRSNEANGLGGQSAVRRGSSLNNNAHDTQNNINEPANNKHGNAYSCCFS